MLTCFDKKKKGKKAYRLVHMFSFQCTEDISILLDFFLLLLLYHFLLINKKSQIYFIYIRIAD